MKTKTELMYAKASPWRLFFIVALPGMISMFAMSIYSILEGAFIGQVLGEGAFAAVNIAFPLVLINFSIADLIGVGASVPISIALGKEDHGSSKLHTLKTRQAFLGDLDSDLARLCQRGEEILALLDGVGHALINESIL